MIPTATIDMLDDVYAAVTDVCSGLDDAQWATPTDCPGWSVQDNLSHLIGTERHLEQLPSTAHRMAVPDHVRNPIGEFNEYEVDARRGLPGSQVLAEWNELVARRLDTLRHADTAYFDQPMATPTGPGTMADFLDIRVLDLWGHEQDIRRALGRPGNLDTPAAGHTIDRLLRTLPIVVGKRAGCPEGHGIRLRITGPTERDVHVEVHGGRAAVVARPSTEPAATVRMDTETFLVLAMGRRAPGDVDVEVAGDAALGQRVVDQLNMMI